MLELRNVVVTYGHGRHAVTAVDDVSLAVAADSIVGLVGESGSGKSTLAKAAVGLAPLASGAIAWKDVEFDPATRRRGDLVSRPLQYVFQDPYASLNPRMSVGASISEGLRGSSGRARPARIAELLEMVRLDPSDVNKLPRQLSGGQRQRVAIARALAAEPQILIADEITSALDVSVQGAVLNLLKEIQSRTGVGILFISHNLAVVRYMADSIAVMQSGQLVEHGPAEDVIERPSHPYTRRLLEAVPSMA
ncbi:peptide/nickel transport system ATP-binding protein [Jiangella alba]|uniref:Peptide/nickel transport system ATP-binding protein n=1 Tax=Jiangella alba TaxID=561176 RepID=A0A1H5L783_9ACTN|nr:ATP-binding cassette domain-containing protein [Jiangella alba]SEE72181.1 peptide/nickel transport system ATP-binding protein [Jiangella alba]